MSDAPTPQTPTDSKPDSVTTTYDGKYDKIDAGPRTSGDVSLLVTEAELVDRGIEIDNPARPVGAEVVDDVMARLDEDVRPAWVVVGDE